MIFLLGLLGSCVELLLLEHTEEPRQWIPLILMALSLLTLGWYGVTRGPLSLRAFQGMMLLFVISGCIGIFLHYQSNVEFELEMRPALTGVELFKKAIQGAMPALAPGTMIQLGLLGLAITYRHPVFRKSHEKSECGE